MLINKGLIKEQDVGVYIGETSRTLMERATEHVNGAEKIEIDNFINWANSHNELREAPRMRFKVTKKCKDALSR